MMVDSKMYADSRANLAFEHQVMDAIGTVLIAGVDEAGRGAIAGPVYAAAVILDLENIDSLSFLSEVDDSKTKSPRQREELFPIIQSNVLAYGIGFASASTIDREGIISANAQAMSRAVSSLMPAPVYLLIDGRMRLKNLVIKQESIIRGDSKSLSIAAASILAKVSRDRRMDHLAQEFPGYGWHRNKGYCTPEHVEALAELGPTSEHRHTFAPLKLTLLKLVMTNCGRNTGDG